MDAEAGQGSATGGGLPGSPPGRADDESPTTWVAVAVALCLLVVGVAMVWRGVGGRWAVVDTPSMGTAIPVGSLVLTRPSPIEGLQRGDVVMYRSPPRGKLYTHRVVGPAHDGLEVRGDLNGASDPYPVTATTLVGRVVAHWWGVGYLVEVLPFVLLVGLLLALGGRWVPLRWRSSTRLLGTCLAITVCGLVLRPYVRPVIISSSPDDDAIRVTVVSAGLLPTRVSGSTGQHLDLVDGQVGSVLTRPEHPGGPGMILGTPHPTGWWLVGVVVLCLLPLIWCLVIGLSPAEPLGEASDDPAARAAPEAA